MSLQEKRQMGGAALSPRGISERSRQADVVSGIQIADEGSPCIEGGKGLLFTLLTLPFLTEPSVSRYSTASARTSLSKPPRVHQRN